MSGLMFLGTTKLEELTIFYLEQVGMDLWLDQGGCRIFSHGNLLLGFCQKEDSQKNGIITFFYENRKKVDEIYEKIKESAEAAPRFNPEYNIYHFYGRDPENRSIEFQCFENKISDYLTGSQNLKFRRSIRRFKQEIPDRSLIEKVFDICRYSPTSMNRQKYYYVITENPVKINQLARIRGASSAPLAHAPYCVAVCCTNETRRVQQDADIAGCYLLLAAHSQGLGTCWITDMDRLEVKEILNIDQDDYIACLTPLGYPDEEKGLPERRRSEKILRWE